MTLPGFGRASEPALLVLLTLVNGSKHGYAMAEEIEALTGRRPGPGTLYGAISRLEDRGLIESEESVTRRKPYRLTPNGMAEVRREIAALSSLADEGRRRLRLAGTTS